MIRARWLPWLLLAPGLLAPGAPPARACTTFCLNDGASLVFGKNYDWNVADGLVVVNKRGVEKVAFTEDSPAAWTARFGSVTFNQYGREFPSGGMNERGLVVELMWLEDTQYPEPDPRGGLPNLQWIQYQLDRSATVDDVVASDTVVRITRGGSAKIHFLVADATGACAAVEYLGGRMVVHRGKSMPIPALTNDTYERSVAYARAQKDTGGVSSLDRFARVAHRAKKARGASAIDEAFDLLAGVAQGDYTQWSIVYDIGGRRVHFRTQANREIRWVNLASLDFDCASPVRVIDLNGAFAGDLSAKLEPYLFDVNLRLIRASFEQTEFLRGVSADAVEDLARYPERTRCAGGNP